MAKRVNKVDSLSMPQSFEEVDKLVGLIGQYQRIQDEINLEVNNRVEQIKIQAAEKTDMLELFIREAMQQISIFAAVNRDVLTEQGKKKTISLRSGELRWRLNPPGVDLTNVREVIKRLEALGLKRFIRYKPEINKTAMLAEPDVAGAIEGVKISQKEIFAVVPSEIQIELVREGRKVTRSPAK